MKQTRSTLMLLVLAVLVAIGLPYYLSSQKASALDVKTKALKTEEAAFKAKSVTGEKIRKAKVEWTAQQTLLAAAMPANSDIQGAIRTLQGLTDGDAAPDRVRWVGAQVTNVAATTAVASTVTTTVKPDAAAPKTTVKLTAAADGPTIPTGGFDITISVEGSREKVLAFVTKIQQRPDVLPRLFAVKSVSLSVDKAATSTGGTGAPASSTQGASDHSTKASVKLKVTTFGVAPEKAAADAANVVAQVPAGAGTSVPSGTTTIAPKP
jgi:hypothetical protein